ncbi:MAG TPA: toll/interleukin-1 receptor domain-containing protein [Kofleriaceae bacterium]
MTTMFAEARTPEPTISEQQWGRILDSIREHSVVPVIGEYLTLVTIGNPPREVPLASYLAEELELPGPPTASLNEIAVRYLRKQKQEQSQKLELLYDPLYIDVAKAMRKAETFVIPALLKQLAEIRDFDLFVTTSFDPYMALALNEVRFGRRSSESTRVLSYKSDKSVDLPENPEALDHPLVYHLFGKAQAGRRFAVSDEDVLEFVHTLQDTEHQPPHLTDFLREQHLLVLGTRLTGWLTRFFLRVSSPERLRKTEKFDVIVDETANADTDQSLFFKHFGGVEVLPMRPVRFIDELVRRWKEPPAGSPTADRVGHAAPIGPGEVFLSYASEDVAAVKALRERLERDAGVQVWLDKESLRSGDDWERRIADALRGCAICVPVISANAISGNGFRVVRAEWAEALKLTPGRRADQPFIMPLLLDDTRPDDPAIDPGIRKLNWRRWLDEEDLRQFIADVRAGVKKAIST